MSKISDLIAAASVLRAFDKIPEYEKILDAVQSITVLTVSLEEERAKVRQLQEEIDRIREDQIDADKVMRHGDYFMYDGVTICPRCWSIDKRRAQVVVMRLLPSGTCGQCVRCKQQFNQRPRTPRFDED